MKRWLGFALTLMCLHVPQGQTSTDRFGDHSGHRHEVLMVAQGRGYIATCSERDLFVRCDTALEARRIAALHARQTGHRTGVIRD